MKKNKKGFTLIENICAVSIMILLASMAMPSFMNTLYRVQKQADVAAARGIYAVANAAMTSAVLDGEYHSTKESQMGFRVYAVTDKGTETYCVTPVARCNGIPYTLPNGKRNTSVTAPKHNKADYWPKISNAFPNLNDEIASAYAYRGPLMHFDSHNPNFKINCWYVVRKVDPSISKPTRSNVRFVGTEIWVGESCLSGTGDNGLKFRVYPNPDIEYLNGGNFKNYEKPVGQVVFR